MASAVQLSEMIGRTGQGTRPQVKLRNLYPPINIDWTQTDYQWWDKLRRGKQPGYELGGLFTEPIGEILADWTLGRGFTLETGDAYADQALAAFIKDNLDTLIDWDYDSYTLGDAYLAINPDGTLQGISPPSVEPHRNPINHRDVWGYTVTTRPEQGVRIVDEYHLRTDERDTPYRKLTIQQRGETTEAEFPLLIDKLPIVALHHKRSTNEVFGRPGYEGLRALFAEYDDVFTKGLGGVKLMGNPIPTVEGADDPAQEIENNKTSTETIQHRDGTTEDVPVIDLALLSFLVFGKGASFNFKGPGSGFTEDAGRMLEYLFLLMLQRSRIPEWAWGGAIASSKASVEAQMPAFARFIEGRQRRIGKRIIELAQVWLAYRALVDRRIRPDLAPEIIFSEVMARDEALTRDWADLLLRNGAIRKETAVRAADLPGVDDPTGEVEAAQVEAQDRAALQDEAISREIDRMAAERESNRDPAASGEGDAAFT